MLILCDKGCKKEFDIDKSQSIERVDNNVELLWLTCPHCNRKYLLYATNNKIKTLQDKVRIELKKSKVNEQAVEEVKSKIANEQQKLKRKYSNG